MLLAALLQFAHAAEDAAVLLQAEVVGFQRAGGLDVEAVVEQDGAEHEALGIDIGGKTLFHGVSVSGRHGAIHSAYGSEARFRSSLNGITLWINARFLRLCDALKPWQSAVAARFRTRAHKYPQAFHQRSKTYHCSLCFTRFRVLAKPA